MPIVSTPGQPQYPSTPIVPSMPTTPVVNDPPIVPIFDPPAVIPVAFQPQVQTPVSSRLQNLMSTPPVSNTMLSDDNMDADPFDNEDAIPFEDDADDDGFPPLPQMSMPPLGAPKQQLALSRMTEDQRRKAINDAFSLVLGKEPTDRDFSYYRFSTLTEEGLMKSLLSLPEHKQMVDKAKEHTNLKQGMSDLDLRVKQLDANMNSLQQELVTLQQLLVEKNKFIQQMRGIPVENQVVMTVPRSPSMQPQYAQPAQQSMQSPASTNATEAKTMPDVIRKTLPGPLDEMKSMLGALFGGKSKP